MTVCRLQSFSIFGLLVFGPLALAASVVLTGCGAPPDPADTRSRIDARTAIAIDELADRRPDIADDLELVEGYGVFSFVELAAGLGGGAGSGVVIDNETGEQTYMRIIFGEATAGFVARDERMIFLFHDRTALDAFEAGRVDFGTAAGAAAAASPGKAEVGVSDTLVPGVSVYRMTDTGVAAAASFYGMSFEPLRGLEPVVD